MIVLYHDESDSVDSTKLDGMCSILLLGHCWNKAFPRNRRADPTRVYVQLVPSSMGMSSLSARFVGGPQMKTHRDLFTRLQCA
jgi:hypothetical protein